MAATTGIEWTDATWNPVTGCTKISPGCKNCYAERMTLRLKAMGQPRYANGFQVTTHADALTIPLHWRKPRRIFVNSMSDLFHQDVPDEFIDRVFAVMALCRQHTFQCLSKRPQRMLEYINKARSRVAALVYNERYEQGTSTALFGGEWGIRNRRRGSDLAADETARTGRKGRRRLSQGSHSESVPARKSRIHDARRLSVGDHHNTESQDSGQCSSSCLGEPERFNTGRLNNQPQERQEVRQPTGESGTRYLPRAAETRVGSTPYQQASSQRLSPPEDTPDRSGCDRDQKIEGIRDDDQGHRGEVPDVGSSNLGNLCAPELEAHLTWPLPNVILGVSVEDQQRADERIPKLLECPAALHFLSAEPLLGELDVSPWLPVDTIGGVEMEPLIRWVIVGAESGPRRRPTETAWIRSLRDQCEAAGTPFLLKQMDVGGKIVKMPLLDGKQWPEVPEVMR